MTWPVTGKLEIEVRCDCGLRYEHTIEAIMAVSRYVSDDGRRIVPMSERVRFGRPLGPAEVSRFGVA